MMSYFLPAMLALASAGREKGQTETILVTQMDTSTTDTTTPPGGFVYTVELDRIHMGFWFYEASDYDYVSVEVVGHSASGLETGLSWRSPLLEVVENTIIDEDDGEWM